MAVNLIPGPYRRAGAGRRRPGRTAMPGLEIFVLRPRGSRPWRRPGATSAQSPTQHRAEQSQFRVAGARVRPHPASWATFGGSREFEPRMVFRKETAETPAEGACVEAAQVASCEQPVGADRRAVQRPGMAPSTSVVGYRPSGWTAPRRVGAAVGRCPPPPFEVLRLAAVHGFAPLTGRPARNKTAGDTGFTGPDWTRPARPATRTSGATAPGLRTPRPGRGLRTVGHAAP